MKNRNVARYAWFVAASSLFLAVAVFPVLPGLEHVPLIFAVTAFQSFIFGALGIFILLVALGKALIGVKIRKNTTEAASTSEARSPRHLPLIGSVLLAISCFIGSWLASNGSALVQIADIPAPAAVKTLSFAVSVRERSLEATSFGSLPRNVITAFLTAATTAFLTPLL